MHELFSVPRLSLANYFIMSTVLFKIWRKVSSWNNNHKILTLNFIQSTCKFCKYMVNRYETCFTRLFKQFLYHTLSCLPNLLLILALTRYETCCTTSLHSHTHLFYIYKYERSLGLAVQNIDPWYIGLPNINSGKPIDNEQTLKCILSNAN